MAILLMLCGPIARAWGRLGGVVDRNHPADGRAAVPVEVRHGRLERVTADVTKIPIDAVLGEPPERFFGRIGLMVDRLA